MLILEIKDLSALKTFYEYFSSECSIYQVDNGHKVMFSKMNDTRFNFGYLRVDKDTPPMETQVFIKFINK